MQYVRFFLAFCFIGHLFAGCAPSRPKRAAVHPEPEYPSVTFTIGKQAFKLRADNELDEVCTYLMDTILEQAQHTSDSEFKTHLLKHHRELTLLPPTNTVKIEQRILLHASQEENGHLGRLIIIRCSSELCEARRKIFLYRALSSQESSRSTRRTH